ncbi:MAG TPA: hypothetical protein O0X14_03045, partial [Methanocorpusculum sp.]|nr:hypothetical protein [Methanocorpusculum sp.]
MSATDVIELISSTEISLTSIRHAICHLTKPNREILYNLNHPNHRSITGKYFEALVYEMILQASNTSNKISSVVAKFSDAKYIPYNKYFTKGVWYSRDGNILVTLNGRIVAEFDFLIQTSDGTRVFGEIVINPTGINQSEIQFKKKLLSKLYKDPIEPVLVLSIPTNINNSINYAVIPNGEKS